LIHFYKRMVSPNDEVATPCEGSPDGKDVVIPVDPKTAAYDALGKGKRHLLVQDAESAVTCLGEACELFSAQFGETAVECAEAYLYYGKALLELARLENGVLGGPMGGEEGANSENEEDGDEQPENGTETEKESEPSKNDDAEEEATEADDKEADEEGDDDEPTNLQLAWEMLDLAKVVYTKQVTEVSAEAKDDLERKLCETLLTLGEVSLENENYGQAEEDLLNCLKLRVDKLPADSRSIAETHYQLGIAQGFAMKYEEAIDSLNAAITVLDTRMKNLKNKSESLDENTKKEIDDLEALIPEIREKITDTKEMKEEYLKKMRASVGLPGVPNGSSSSGFSGSSGAGASGSTEGAKPISSIAVKRKTGDEPAEPKKSKDA